MPSPAAQSSRLCTAALCRSLENWRCPSTDGVHLPRASYAGGSMGATAPVLLDRWLPDADARERHALVILAPPAVVWATLWRRELGGPAGRLLFALRLLPAALAGGRTMRQRIGDLARRPALTLRDLPAAGFALLAECPADVPDAREATVVFGLTGRFWILGGGLVPTDPARWAAGPPAGMVQGAWSFELAAHPAGGTVLATETRVRCADAAARRAFLRYWRVIRPASGLLRRLILHRVRRAAERSPRTGAMGRDADAA